MLPLIVCFPICDLILISQEKRRLEDERRLLIAEEKTELSKQERLRIYNEVLLPRKQHAERTYNAFIQAMQKWQPQTPPKSLVPKLLRTDDAAFVAEVLVAFEQSGSISMRAVTDTRAPTETKRAVQKTQHDDIHVPMVEPRIAPPPTMDTPLNALSADIRVLQEEHETNKKLAKVEYEEQHELLARAQRLRVMRVGLDVARVTKDDVWGEAVQSIANSSLCHHATADKPTELPTTHDLKSQLTTPLNTALFRSRL